MMRVRICTSRWRCQSSCCRSRVTRYNLRRYSVQNSEKSQKSKSPQRIPKNPQKLRNLNHMLRQCLLKQIVSTVYGRPSLTFDRAKALSASRPRLSDRLPGAFPAIGTPPYLIDQIYLSSCLGCIGYLLMNQGFAIGASLRIWGAKSVSSLLLSMRCRLSTYSSVN